MKKVVGMGDLKLTSNPEDLLVTFALGSCLGITIYDPVVRVGGMLHVMLPSSNVDPVRAKQNPATFIDTGVPKLFRGAYRLGADKKRLIVKVAGGARVVRTTGGQDAFKIGERNFAALRQLFWRNGVLIRGKDVGGHHPRTMELELTSGQVEVKTRSGGRNL